MWFSAPLAAQDAAPAAPMPTAEREADLLRQLREAESPQAAERVAGELRGLWSRSGSAAIDLLLRRGQDALEQGRPEEAAEHFTAAIDWAPDFAEPYVGRASAFYLTGRAGPAIDDLRQALVLNPDDWEALQGFAAILDEVGRPADALEVWRRVHDMHPQNPEAAAAVSRLAAETEGQTL
ncbi:tetratricopeptide repeat protein [Rubellimicrobium aerolatum]|uniref:Tetratricopeptide repeat protein n=1 Tax=Rubellimicrobium aerolatum TaxID=490979 RepID=A0ABW0SEK3_9RHOB|nr:tetratricopeptide (TPR) repeat protein [Rubellimicrobium aerolatum]